MTMTPTPEQFLAMREPDDLEDETASWEASILAGVDVRPSPFDWPNGPLESIAASLQQLAGAVSGQIQEDAASRWLRESLDDLEAQHAVVVELVDEIEAIVKPSTSKLANTVREAIGRYRAPEVPADQPPVDDEKPGGPPAVQCLMCERYFATQELLDRHECVPVPAANAAEMGHQPPAADAGIEVWREYARSLGHDVSDQTNRSQIRTLLGLPHHDA